MKKLVLILFVAGCYSTAFAKPTPMPYEKLREGKNKVKFKYGYIQLRAWKARDKFPEFQEIVMMDKTERKRDDGVEFRTGKADLVIGKDKIGFGTQGRIEEAPEAYDWAPILVFVPKNAGPFKIAGKLHINTKEEGDANVKWAVVKINMKKKKMTVLAEGVGAKGNVIDLAEKVGKIDLKRGEVLGITTWRKKFHWWGGGNLRGFTINR